MKNSLRPFSLALALSLVSLASACADDSEVGCVDDNDCRLGRVCSESGLCIGAVAATANNTSANNTTANNTTANNTNNTPTNPTTANNTTANNTNNAAANNIDNANNAPANNANNVPTNNTSAPQVGDECDGPQTCGDLTCSGDGDLGRCDEPQECALSDRLSDPNNCAYSFVCGDERFPSIAVFCQPGPNSVSCSCIEGLGGSGPSFEADPVVCDDLDQLAEHANFYCGSTLGLP